jgi:hypothetical protein
VVEEATTLDFKVGPKGEYGCRHILYSSVKSMEVCHTVTEIRRVLTLPKLFVPERLNQHVPITEESQTYHADSVISSLLMLLSSS